MSRPGDWLCGTCQHLNFYWRQVCRRCHGRRSQVSANGLGGQICVYPSSHPRVPDFRAGDWFCKLDICQAHNFANRRACFKCGAFKNLIPFCRDGGFVFRPVAFEFYGRGGGRMSRRWWKQGDWLCGRLDCFAHNYGSRVRCFRCKSSRELVAYVPS